MGVFNTLFIDSKLIKTYIKIARFDQDIYFKLKGLGQTCDCPHIQTHENKGVCNRIDAKLWITQVFKILIINISREDKGKMLVYYVKRIFILLGEQEYTIAKKFQ
jgi:hypothetical protein